MGYAKIINTCIGNTILNVFPGTGKGTKQKLLILLDILTGGKSNIIYDISSSCISVSLNQSNSILSI